jgi:endonuclease YncB( thermonuclease family)
MNCIRRYLLRHSVRTQVPNDFDSQPSDQENHSLSDTDSECKKPDTDKDMENATYDNLQPFVPEITHGKIVRVYDGDTVTIAARIHIDDEYIAKLFRFSVRLRGIDTPEMKTKNATEKALAIKARDVLSAQFLNKMVLLENVDYDKYGRILADMITVEGNIHISEWMLVNGYAVEYDGGTKHRPSEWTKIAI